ncbi:Predicted O-linked N-acetylglucosamine transferase, SPINDLY family [Rhodoferax sp. OV413]|uniref:O-linked N-acetylglucosamine transferase, SPINDLY family protein n=1 Tax=Rhodoferax sp. OV413 TaxID=1855285 RepID=UPI000882CBAF|nr:tetratricopeptide repeat protein [Rhodoferax sp. OV413]SDP91356.1 Predicted O-linked N-acetylglucosamine transferase, SPINDLY family [Rhodoferax sp. OV413]
MEETFASAVLRAWRQELEFPELIECTSQLEAQQLGPLAIVLYQTWLTRTDSPYAHAVNFNLGVSLSNQNDLPGAQAAYRRAIAIAPAFIQPRLNLGMLYERMGQIDQALLEWRWVEQNISPAAPENRPLVLMALNHLGRVLDTRKQLQDALQFLGRSLAIDPHQPDVVHHWVHLRQKQCVWPIYAPLDGISVETMLECTSALAMLSVTDDPAVQLAAARRFVHKKVISDVPRLAPAQDYQHRKLRIAYASSDFCMHPVSLLTAQLFELHDRSQFEVYGFCWSPEDGSAMRQRVITAMDHFFRIDKMSDEAAAQLMRDHEIDILVDLQGQTSGARANMLAYHPAPVQITYLGLPATTGLPSIDYVIADRFLIPEEIAPQYSEKPLYMPDIYQVSDRQRGVAATPSRASCGLPAEGFVFCSLNNNYKYTPEVFDTWMRILQRTPGSLLWLLSDNPWAEQNLVREAQARGVDPSRLFFAPRVSPENYLGRFPVADLFLDTFPFNAGTTANDALWMGLPVLTYCGRSFASRMAGALLTAAQLPELITYNLQDYEEKAVALATDPQACSRLRAHLQEVHEHGVLFDTPLFVRNLEANFQRLCAPQPPAP